MEHLELSKEERQEKIFKMRSANPKVTQQELADLFGVDRRTIARDYIDLVKQKKLLKKQIIPQDNGARNEIVQLHVDNYEMAKHNILKTEAMLQQLENLITDGRIKCPHCGEWFDAVGVNPHTWASYFKGREVFTRQVELNAKLLGQISDNPVIMALKLDADSEVVIRALANLDREQARSLFNELMAVDAKRKMRMPEFETITESSEENVTNYIEGEFKQLPSGE